MSDSDHSDKPGADKWPIHKRNSYASGVESLFRFFERPAEWFHDKVVVPNQKIYPWYHQQFRRVRTIEDCYTDEWDCIYEANEQFRRDKKVEGFVVQILRGRLNDCVREEAPDFQRCKQVEEDWREAAGNWFCKYGDLGYYASAERAFMKQKHRLLWERRHGRVGSGMKPDPYAPDPEPNPRPYFGD